VASYTTLAANEMADQIAEYESQLRDVEALLQDSPEDASLQSLKSDLLELISIAKQSAPSAPHENEETKLPAIAGDVFDKALQAAVGTSVGVVDEESKTEAAATAASSNTFADTMQEAAVLAAGIPTSIDASSAGKDVPKKKSKKPAAEFEVPQHLIPLDTDSAAERNKKRRAIKALKSKWKQSKKEAESAQKQKSWQSFQKKKKLKTSSIFSSAGDAAAVGVVVSAKRRQNDA